MHKAIDVDEVDCDCTCVYVVYSSMLERRSGLLLTVGCWHKCLQILRPLPAKMEASMPTHPGTSEDDILACKRSEPLGIVAPRRPKPPKISTLKNLHELHQQHSNIIN